MPGRRLSEQDAYALVLASPLLDVGWYAAQVDRTFASREEAAAHWVSDARPAGASPYPLLEPDWVWPTGGWRKHAPDPLSAWLARPGARPRGPHPCVDTDALGPLEDWATGPDHDPAALLPEPVERAALGDVVVVLPAAHLARTVRWVRALGRDTDVVVPLGAELPPSYRRVLEAVAADRPRVHVGASVMPAPDDGVVVEVDDDVLPPGWPWLPALLAALEGPGVAAAQPLVLGADLTVAAPVSVGRPTSTTDRLDGLALPGRYAGVEARRVSGGAVVEGRRVLAASSWVRGTPSLAAPSGPDWDTLAERAGGAVVMTGRPALSWSIDVAATAAPIGRRWGDWHFARSLADALVHLGQRVEIDHPETRSRSTRDADVVLVLRGLEPVAPVPGVLNLLWVISHPDDVTDEELLGFDLVYAASAAWAADRAHLGIACLLQATDASRFHPGVRPLGGDAPGAGRVLFVGNARGGMRPVVAAAREAGVPLDVVGAGWDELGVDAVADRVANTDLPALYAGAGVVLADHHADMAAAGFVSNRVLDVLAVGGRLVVDDVAGLRESLGESLRVDGWDPVVWRTPADLARLAVPSGDSGGWTGQPADDVRRRVAEHVVAEHSFDARAELLLDVVLARLGRG
ncbi:MAG: hypothetical protein CMH83_14585 [Nocardioides sp.]|nr:hypothetical protein [Nocardioides sp.]